MFQLRPGRIARLGFVACLLSSGLVATFVWSKASKTPLVTRASITPRPAVSCPVNCDDHDQCTVDSCDTATGTCRFDPVSCDDHNSCTVDSCQPNQGCLHVPRPDGTACEDGPVCTLSFSCQAGACVGAQVLPAGSPCNDGNSCTTNDVCNGVHECAGTPAIAGASCDDGNACTHDDQCIEGAQGGITCSGTPVDCTDSDLCTQDLCDPATGQCQHPPVDCNDGNVCTSDVCNPDTGACRRDNVPGACDDHVDCTTGDTCVGGNCTYTGFSSCDDGVACTMDQCFPDGCHHDPVPGLCPPPEACASYVCTVFAGGGGGCVRQNAGGTGNCTPPDSCNLYGCVRGECSLQFTIPCADDNNPCTDEVCPGGVCTHRPKADGSPCNQDRCPVGNGVCQAGQCVGQATWNCDDGNPCTNDTCSIAGGYCQHDPVSCDDGNQCTFDTCNPATGACGHALTSCDDGNLCTTDLPCSPNVGCVHIVCDDGNECTKDTCLSPQTGACSHAPIPGPCDDHNPCTFNDTCMTNAQGQFVCIGSSSCPSDNNLCTDDIPDPDTCECFHSPHDCSDGIACTTDTCAPSTGCAHQPHPAAQAVAVAFGSNQTATWGATSDATIWNTYRGTIPAALMGSRPSGAYDHTCFESADAFGDGATLTTDAAIPPPGSGYYYFVSGENPCGEGALGSGDSGAGGGPTPVPNPAPCPTPP